MLHTIKSYVYKRFLFFLKKKNKENITFKRKLFHAYILLYIIITAATRLETI